MIFFWLSYTLLSVLICFIVSLLIENKILSALVFLSLLAILCSVWFKTPGESLMAPIFSIFLLESLILESHGLMRLLRPLGASFIVLAFIYLVLRRLTKS